MNFGYFSLAQSADDDDRSVAAVYRDTLEEAVLAEELGFDSYWTAEHHFSAYGNVPSPLLLLTAVASRTSRVHLGSAVVLAPFYHPVRLVEEAAMVDIISGGRLLLGLGRGYQPMEFEGYGIDPGTTRESLEKTIGLLCRTWGIGTDAGSGPESPAIPEVRVKPVQTPSPPVFLACISPDSFVRAGELGFHVLINPSITPLQALKENLDRYRESLTDHGYDAAHFYVGTTQQVHVASTDKEAQEAVRPHILAYYESLSSRIAPPTDKPALASYEFYTRSRKRLEEVTFEQLVESQGTAFGSPESVGQRVRFLESELGVTHYLAWMDFSGMPREILRASMEMFAHQVIPSVAGRAQAGRSAS